MEVSLWIYWREADVQHHRSEKGNQAEMEIKITIKS